MDNDITAVREALRTRLLTAFPTGLNVYARWPGALSSPAAVVIRRQTEFDPTFDLAAEATLAIKVLVAVGSEDAAGEDLDDYVAPAGALSIRAALEGDPTLGGLVDYLHVATAEGEEITTYKGNDYLSTDLTLVIG